MEKIDLVLNITGIFSIVVSLLLFLFWLATGEFWQDTRGVDFLAYFTFGMLIIHMTETEKKDSNGV